MNQIMMISMLKEEPIVKGIRILMNGILGRVQCYTGITGYTFEYYDLDSN